VRAPAPSTEEHTALVRRIAAMTVNAIVVLVIATAIFIVLVNTGIVSH
jgi:hypothetical protein